VIKVPFFPCVISHHRGTTVPSASAVARPDEAAVDVAGGAVGRIQAELALSMRRRLASLGADVDSLEDAADRLERLVFERRADVRATGMCAWQSGDNANERTKLVHLALCGSVAMRAFFRVYESPYRQFPFLCCRGWHNGHMLRVVCIGSQISSRRTSAIIVGRVMSRSWVF